MQEVIIGYQGEMSLKGLNRNQFESALMKILRYRLKDAGRFNVWCGQSTFYMEPEDDNADLDLAFERVSKVFGLAAVSRSAVCEKDFDAICRTAEAYLGETLRQVRTFKVEARRADKTFPMDSPALMRELGAYLLEHHPRLKVDVHHPDCKVIVEIRDKGAYVHGPKTNTRSSVGGLPVGTSGRALNLLSGGIDSPVAAYRMAKAGPGPGSHPLRLAPLYLGAGPPQGDCPGPAHQRLYRQLQPVCGALYPGPRSTSGTTPPPCCSPS